MTRFRCCGSSFGDVRYLLVCAAYVGVMGLVSWSVNSRKSHMGLVGLFWMVVPFLPACNVFFVVGTTIAERLMYPCSCGVVFVICALVDSVFEDPVEAKASRAAAL